MRKILSIFLTVAMLLSLIAVIPFGASAEIAKPQTITFDSVAQQNYYAAAKTSSAIIEYSNSPEQGMAVKLNSIVRESNCTWINAFRIAQVNSDGSVSAYKVTAGNKYTIKFKVKTENLQLDGGIAGLRLFHVSDAQNMSNFLKNAGTAPKDWKNTYISDIAGTTDGWVEISKTFTAPSDIGTMDELAISATYNYQGPWSANNQNILIDDIIITPAPSDVETYFSTFDTAEEVQADGVSYATTKSIGKIVDTGDATQGKAFLIPEMCSKNNNNNWGHNIRLAGIKDGSLTPYKVRAGETYNITFKYYLDSASGINSLNFYLLNVSNANNGYCLAQSKTAAQDWAHIDLGSTSTSKNTWITVNKTFTVPTTIGGNDELALMPIVSDWNIKNVVMYIDDLKITQYEPATTSNVISFNEDYYNGSANCGYGKIEDTNDATHGKAFKFTSFSKGGNQWPQCVRLLADNGTDPYYVKLNGRKYEISFDIKKDIADVDFYIAAHFALPGTNVNKIDTDAANDYNPAKLKFAWTARGVSDGWQRVTYTITTPAKATKGYDYSELILTCYNADVWNDKGNQAVWIDNVSVKALTEVTINGTDVKWLDPETEISSLQTDIPGAMVKGWYYDADLTKPVYSKYVGYYDSEIWATYKSVVIDFDNVNSLYSNLWDDGTFNVVEYDGIYNSKGLSNARADGFINSNSSWPDVLRLNTADGKELKTYAGHTYRLTMQVKAIPSLITNHATLYLAYEKPGYNASDGPSTATYPLLNNETYSETAILMKTAFRNSDGSFSDTPQWRKFEFEFEGLDDGLPLYIIPWQVNGCSVTFDDISIVDVTAQKNVTDEAGNKIASGYYGEDVVISAPADNGDTNFIKYTDANGDVVTEMMLKEDVQLNTVKSQIAVTATNANPANNMVSFKVRYEGIYYNTISDSTDIAVKKITVGNRRYDIDEIGVLVLPKENATEALTLENYETLGAVKVANSDLKFVATGDDSITINAGIITFKFARNYTVVGYVKYSNGVIYSQSRVGIAENLNDASGLEDTTALTFGNYNLVDNAEFNTDGEVSSDDFRFWLNKQTDGTMTRYSTTDNAYVENGNMVLTSEVTSENTLDFAYMLGNKTFKHGYVEIRAKFAKDLAGCIWFNFPGIPQSEYVYPENDTDIYVNAEIDIAEFGSTDKFVSTLHSWGTKDGVFGEAGQIRLEDVNGNNSGTVCDLSEWHTFGIERTSDYIKIYVDGVLTFEYTLEEALATCTWGTNVKHTANYNWQYRTENEVKALFDNPTYLILSISPTDLNQGATTASYIDYVRYYE